MQNYFDFDKARARAWNVYMRRMNFDAHRRAFRLVSVMQRRLRVECRRHRVSEWFGY